MCSNLSFSISDFETLNIRHFYSNCTKPDVEKRKKNSISAILSSNLLKYSNIPIFILDLKCGKKHWYLPFCVPNCLLISDVEKLNICNFYSYFTKPDVEKRKKSISAILCSNLSFSISDVEKLNICNFYSNFTKPDVEKKKKIQYPPFCAPTCHFRSRISKHLISAIFTQIAQNQMSKKEKKIQYPPFCPLTCWNILTFQYSFWILNVEKNIDICHFVFQIVFWSRMWKNLISAIFTHISQNQMLKKEKNQYPPFCAPTCHFRSQMSKNLISAIFTQISQSQMSKKRKKFNIRHFVLQLVIFDLRCWKTWYLQFLLKFHKTRCRKKEKINIRHFVLQLVIFDLRCWKTKFHKARCWQGW